MFDSNHVQNDFIYQTGGSSSSSVRMTNEAFGMDNASARRQEQATAAGEPERRCGDTWTRDLSGCRGRPCSAGSVCCG
jgi:hypothetical protein